MLERANTATREVLARSVRGVGRLGANSLKERYQSPELSRDHTPTRSLRLAERQRRAACLCCMQAGLRAPECSGTQLQAMQTAGALVGGVRYGVDARRRRVLLASPASRRTLGRTTPAACAARAPCRSASGSTRLWSPRPRVALEAECRHDRIVRTATCKPCLLALVASAHGAVRVLEQAVRAARGAGALGVGRARH